MGIHIVGAETDDSGPKGVVARFLLASDSDDHEAALALLTRASREGLQPGSSPAESGTARIGEPIPEGDDFVVPVTLESEEGDQEMPFVVTEEDGALRIDMDRTFEKLMGFNPAEMMESMGESMANAMGGAMEGMANALAEGLGAAVEGMGGALREMGEALEGAAPSAEKAGGTEGAGAAVVGRQWVLNGEAFPPQEILDVALDLGTRFTPPFLPPVEDLGTEEFGAGGSRTRTTRYGSPEEGFTVMESTTEMDNFASRNVTVNAYGMAPGRDLSLVWCETVLPDSPSRQDISIRATAGEAEIAAIHEHLEGRFGVLAAYDS